MFRSQLYKSLRILHRLRSQDPVEEEFRGWNWDKPPLRPRGYFGLGVSEVAYRYCPTRRDFYLRRMGVRGTVTEPLYNGTLVHMVFNIAAEDVRRGLVLGKRGWEVYEEASSNAVERLKKAGIDVDSRPWLLRLYKMLVLDWSAEEWYTLFTEYKVDGSVLGLSRNLRADGLAEGGLVLEVKFGRPANFHKLALAGYALALEASLETAFDYGVLVYESNNGDVRVDWEPVYISTSLRKEFIEARDELIDMLINDIEPPKASSCPSSCPFKEVCG